MNNPGMLLIVMSGLILTFGDFLMKKWIDVSSYNYFVYGLIVYLIGTLFMVFSFRYENIAVASILSVLINIITLVILSWLYFNEKLNIYQIIGIFLGLASVFFLEYFNKK